jgi:hypothetical protein
MQHNLNVLASADACEQNACVPRFHVEATGTRNTSCMLSFQTGGIRIRYQTDNFTLHMDSPNSAQRVVAWSGHHTSPMGWLSGAPFDYLIKLQW